VHIGKYVVIIRVNGEGELFMKKVLCLLELLVAYRYSL
jgi:hypothetical protein